MPIKVADSRKYSPAGDFYNRNPEENSVSRSRGDKPPDPPVITQIVPDSPDRIGTNRVRSTSDDSIGCVPCMHILSGDATFGVR